MVYCFLHRTIMLMNEMILTMSVLLCCWQVNHMVYCFLYRTIMLMNEMILIVSVLLCC